MNKNFYLLPRPFKCNDPYRYTIFRIRLQKNLSNANLMNTRLSFIIFRFESKISTWHHHLWILVFSFSKFVNVKRWAEFDPITGNTDWSRAQLGWGQFNHFQGEYTSSHSSHQHSSHASHAGTPSSGTGNSASAAEWYDQGYDYSQHAQLNYHRSVGGIF